MMSRAFVFSKGYVIFIFFGTNVLGYLKQTVTFYLENGPWCYNGNDFEDDLLSV